MQQSRLPKLHGYSKHMFTSTIKDKICIVDSDIVALNMKCHCSDENAMSMSVIPISIVNIVKSTQMLITPFISKDFVCI